MVWHRFPLFRVFLAFSVGILIANFIDVPGLFSARFFATSAGLLMITSFSRFVFFDFSRRWLFGLSLSLFFVGLGLAVTELYSERSSPKHLQKLPAKGSFYLVQLMENPQEKARSYGMKARVINADSSGEPQLASTNIMLYLQKDSAAAHLRYGDRLILKNRLSALKPPANPQEFDYRDFLQLKAIYFQAYASSENWKKTGSGYGNPVIAWAGKLRRLMLERIDDWKMSQQETAITKALLLGYRYDIKDDQLKAYASAGAMHVLAVSGLHVGIVYLMAFYFLYFLDRVKYGNILRSFILVVLLWGFALITGLSASVVRASTMFSFVAIGTAFKRSTSVYNTILGSAMLLMLIKPTYLFEVGFQLSYAAVFGIVWLQPKFENLWRPHNWILRQIWAITTVSLAAQIATFPLSIYYFHQFPSLFLVSNLMVIPLVTVLMYTGLSALLLSAAGWVPEILLRTYEWLLWVMNASVAWVEEQSFFLIDQIHINRLELSLLYFIILMGFTWLFAGGYRKLVLATVAVVAFCGSQLWEQVQLVNQQKLVVYAIDKEAAIGLYKGSEGYLLCDSSLWADDASLTFHIKHHWWALDVDSVQQKGFGENIQNPVYKNGNLLLVKNRILYLYEGQVEPPPLADIWIVSSNCEPPYTAKAPTEIVLSGALDYYHRKLWEDWIESQQVQAWDTHTRGAYILASN